MGPKGRKTLVDNWSQYLPMYSTQEPIAPQPQSQNSPAPGSPVPPSEAQPEEEYEEEELAEGKLSPLTKLNAECATKDDSNFRNFFLLKDPSF